MEVLNSIPVRLEPEEVLRKLRLRKVNEDMERKVQELIEAVHLVVRPKAVYEVSYVDNNSFQ
ncbi:unnamed protein product [marine sediment metagenome]|uniref:Uncharacterized protein n=1 Tax=marine sediment metagenome TaxID=412755 RepID=X1UWW1_9ZZZZ